MRVYEMDVCQLPRNYSQSLQIPPFVCITIMRNDIWFDSPLPHSRLALEHKSDHNYSEHRMDNYMDQVPSQNEKEPDSLDGMLESVRVHHGMGQLSPWSKMLHADNHKEESLNLFGGFPLHDHSEKIQDKLLFSEQEDEPATPVKKQPVFKQEHQGELHTTGRKSLLELAQKRRPKEKGLRSLSRRAFQIVRILRNVTYKEVANKLVQEFNQEESAHQEVKEQQNIKRRVYDALNVLIALGVLRKDGRKILADPSVGSNFGRDRYQQTQQVKYLLKEKHLVLQKKKALYQMLTKKRKSMQIIFLRNLQNYCEESQKVQFPFVGIKYISQPNIEICQDVLQIKARQFGPLFGDADLFKWDCECFLTTQLKQKQRSVKIEEQRQKSVKIEQRSFLPNSSVKIEHFYNKKHQETLVDHYLYKTHKTSMNDQSLTQQQKPYKNEFGSLQADMQIKLEQQFFYNSRKPKLQDFFEQQE